MELLATLQPGGFRYHFVQQQTPENRQLARAHGRHVDLCLRPVGFAAHLAVWRPRIRLSLADAGDTLPRRCPADDDRYPRRIRWPHFYRGKKPAQLHCSRILQPGGPCRLAADPFDLSDIRSLISTSRPHALWILLIAVGLLRLATLAAYPLLDTTEAR